MIGERIKRWRAEQGVTLTELAERAKLSISYLSQIERDKTTPSLAALTHIAEALGVGLRYFFDSSDGQETYIIRADARQAEIDPESAIARVCLTTNAATDRIEAYRVTLSPGARPEPFDLQPGEWFSLVLTGELTVKVGNEQFVLAAGDSIHYDALQPHCWSNDGDQPCVVIWCQSSPGRSAALDRTANLQRAPRGDSLADDKVQPERRTGNASNS